MSATIKTEDVPLRVKEEDVIMEDAFVEVDEVIREIPVFLSPELAKELYLLQYPLQKVGPVTSSNTRSQDRNPNYPELREARIKPRHGMLELTQGLPQGMYTMDSSPYRAMRNRTLVSHTIPLQTHMCLGKLDKDSLQLIPLNHITQMRPSLEHINAEMEPEATKEPDTDSKKPVVFQRKESERAAMARRNSYAYKLSSEESEPWCDLEVVSEQKQIDPVESSTDMPHCMQPTQTTEYIASLNYMRLEAGAATTSKREDGLVKRLTALLHLGVPIPFSILYAKFPGFEATSVLKALSVCGVQVLGNYLLNSAMLTDWTRETRKARTLILLVLQTRGKIRRDRLQEVLDIPPPTTYDILQQVARLGKECWTLKIDPDDQHKLDYPRVSELHQKYWKQQEKRFKHQLDKYDKI